MKTLFSLFFISGVIVIFTFFSCSKKESSESAKNNNTALPSTARQNIVGDFISVSPKNGERIPDFFWKDGHMNETSLSAFSGKITLVNFWATWCGPCQHETPDMIEVYNAMKEKDVQFLGISADTGPSAKEDVQNFINEYKIPYAVIIDRDEALQQAFGNVRAYPTTFILGKNGTVLSQWVGLRDKDFFTTELQKYLQ